MSKRAKIALFFSHITVAVIAFASGVYTLPILMAPASPSEAELLNVTKNARFSSEFVRGLQDSDWLHFGEGELFISSTSVAFSGTLAPGPDYRLYFSPQFVQTETDFKRLKSTMVEVSSVKTFNDFLVTIPAHISPDNYTSVIVWCETFEQFITSAQYQ